MGVGTGRHHAGSGRHHLGRDGPADRARRGRRGLVVRPTAATAVAKARPDKRELVAGTSGDVSKLDPRMSTVTLDITVSHNLFDNLTTRDVDLKLVPRLATEWRTTDDTTWEFKLRPG